MPGVDRAEDRVDAPARRATEHEQVADEPLTGERQAGGDGDDDGGADRRDREADELVRGEALADERCQKHGENGVDRRHDERSVGRGCERQRKKDEGVVAEDAERPRDDQEWEPGEAERSTCGARDREHEDAREREADRRQLEGRDRRDPELAGGPAAAPAQRDRHERGKGQEALPRGDRPIVPRHLKLALQMRRRLLP